MDPDRWQRLEALFHEALARPAARRAELIERVDGADAPLKAELEALLGASESASLIEALPPVAAARWIADADAGQLEGRVLGPYKLGALIGAGGMGEVYAAEDTRLRRRTALKLLRSPFGIDSARIRRFEDEARSASALNHPNIVTIYDIGDDGGRPFIVTEFIDGETLRARLEAGPLPIADTISIATQVAEALDAAHRAGIVHRDVKPENIMLRRDGYAKLLDFGVATLADSPSSGTGEPFQSPSSRTLWTGLIGTPDYMAPEQLDGVRADVRADVFSLGLVIYEMAAGRRPFEGRSVEDRRRAVRTRSPMPLEDLAPGVPPQLDRIVAKALQNDPAMRYQSAADLLDDLERLHRRLEQGTAAERHRAAAGRGPLLAAAAITAGTLLIVVGAIGSLTRHDRGTAGTPVSTFVRVTDDAATELYPTLSPDGQWCAYASNARGKWDIYRKPLPEGRAVNLTAASTADETMPAISPDGRRIAFRSSRGGGGIFLMDEDGANVTSIAQGGGNPAWLSDGRHLVYATEGINEPTNRSSVSRIAIVDVTTGVRQWLTTGDAVQPQPSPHGMRVAYWGTRQGQRDIWTVAIEGGPPVAVTSDAAVDWNPVWSPDGRFLYFASNRGGSMNVWRVAIAEQTGVVGSRPEPVTTPTMYAKHLSVSADGARLAYVQSSIRAIVRRIGFDPDAGVTVGEPRTVVQRSIRSTDATVSPDGGWIAFSSEGETREEIFVARSDGTDIRALTDDEHINRLPDWSPDGSRIAFYSNRSGRYEIWSIRPDGSGLTPLSHTTGPGVNTPVWAPDGKRLAYHEAGRTWVAEISQAGTSPELIAPMPGAQSGFTTWSWTAEGQRVLGWTNSPNLKGIYEYSLATKTYRRLTTTGFAPMPVAGGRYVLFLSDPGQLYAWDGDTQTAREIFRGDRVDRFSLPADNRSIYYTALSTEADIWLMTLPRAQ